MTTETTADFLRKQIAAHPSKRTLALFKPRIIENDCCAFHAVDMLGDSIISAHGCTLERFHTATGKLLQEFTGHSEVIKALAIFAGGRYFASGDRKGIIKVWDADTTATKKCLRTLRKHRDTVWALEACRNGLVSASEDGTLIYWNMRTGKSKVFAFNDAVRAATVLPNGFVVLASWEKLWWMNVETGERQVIGEHETGIFSVATLAGGRYVVSGDRHGIMIRWDVQTRKPLQIIEKHGGSTIWTLQGLSDGSWMSGDEKGGLKRWRIGTNTCQQEFLGHSGWRGYINGVVELTDGSGTFISASSDGSLRRHPLKLLDNDPLPEEVFTLLENESLRKLMWREIQLERAIKANDLLQARDLLKGSCCSFWNGRTAVKTNYINGHGNTPAMLAIIQGNEDMVKLVFTYCTSFDATVTCEDEKSQYVDKTALKMAMQYDIGEDFISLLHKKAGVPRVAAEMGLLTDEKEIGVFNRSSETSNESAGYRCTIS